MTKARTHQRDASLVLTYLLFVLLFLSGSTALVSVCRALGAAGTQRAQLNVGDATPYASYLFVIDAGHGGEDGGAVGYVNGIPQPEKDINLKIAQALAQALEDAGATVVMTRTEDTLLYDRNSDYEGRKKALDMAARLAVVEAAQATGDTVLFISIHQNTFPQARYRGLQVYYSANHDESAALAGIIQETAREQLAPDNDRKTKVGDAIYLLKQLQCPAVLVECGFLSNPEECAALATEEYQNRVAYAVFCALREYTGLAR